ncbi:uromodulin [Quercus suber]|uniref:Uromodulin n=1 Tax=Quercus suber TaxID=58331 RepID=A0AAW0K2K6_QUESU
MVVHAIISSSFTATAVFVSARCLSKQVFDINECEDPNLNNCTIAKNCVNTPGSYSCRCPKWYHGSGRKDGEGCEANLLLVFKIAIGKYIY